MSLQVRRKKPVEKSCTRFQRTASCIGCNKPRENRTIERYSRQKSSVEEKNAALAEKFEEINQLARKLAEVDAEKKIIEVHVKKQQEIFAQAYLQFQEI